MTEKAFFEEDVSTPDVYRSTPFQFDRTVIPAQQTKTYGKTILFGELWEGKIKDLKYDLKPLSSEASLQDD